MTNRTADVDDERTVLVVDDEDDIADTYAIWLKQNGFDVMTAYSGEEALAQLNPEVDLLLLDRRMPRVPGDVVLEKARQRQGRYQVSMLTAVEPSGDAIDLPFDEYLTKPVTKAEVLDAIERLMVRDSLEDDFRGLFRLSAKYGTLNAREGGDTEPAEAELEERIRSKRQRIDEKLGRLDDPTEAFALINPPS